MSFTSLFMLVFILRKQLSESYWLSRQEISIEMEKIKIQFHDLAIVKDFSLRLYLAYFKTYVMS
ncbi:hypothetical protein GT3570_15205 [Geobacillus thermoleovorans]|nr:hypothetical protein GT3570_15205 [Geobacillus thermoleovorans]